MECFRIVSCYFALFAMVIIAVFVILDTYACSSHGLFHGVIQIANVDLTSSGETDMSMDVTASVWLETRLHTVKINAVDCISHVDTPSGLHLQMFQTTTSLSTLLLGLREWSC